MPKLSVIIPAYNAEKYIRRCLDSINNQTFKDFECIVVADSCVDSTVEIAESYGVKVFTADVHNDGLARNVGLDNCSGEWILFIDSDDYWVHEYVFELLVDRINSTDADVICFDMVWRHIGIVGAISGRNKMLFPHCTNKCWKKTAICSTRFPGIKPDSDAGFHNKMMTKDIKLDIWDMPLYYYDFLRDGSFSSNLKRTTEQAKSYWCINTDIVQQSTLRFTVIIPAYNAGNRIRKTLDSIKNQTLQNFELIVVCDSCTDNTIEVAREYTDKVLEVNYHNPTLARKDAIDIAQGDYILFTDDDDWWLHEFAFEAIDRKLREENPDLLYFAFIYKGYKYINPEGGQYLPAFWDKVWKRELIQGIDINDIKCIGKDVYMGDVEYQDKALAKNPKIVEWNMPLYYYDYLRPGSMTHKRGW